MDRLKQALTQYTRANNRAAVDAEHIYNELIANHVANDVVANEWGED
jgi:hypothetical protein